MPEIERAYLEKKEELIRNMPELVKFINEAIANTLK
jgi:hypothetical protein